MKFLIELSEHIYKGQVYLCFVNLFLLNYEKLPMRLIYLVILHIL